MKTTVRKTSDPKAKPKDIKDEPLNSTRNLQEEKPNRSRGVATPRTYVQKSSTADIYAQKKKSAVQVARAPKKVSGTSNTSSNVSPMKDFLKSSPSVSQASVRSSYDKKPIKKVDTKATDSARKINTPKTTKGLLNTSVTINSPPARRKLNLNTEPKELVKKLDTKDVKTSKGLEKGDFRDVENARQRTKTRTLDENEVKVLKADVVDNNVEMLNLTRKLNAKPKAFYIDLGDNPSKPCDSIKNKSSDEDISYEDDFESYESDFESYHSDQTQSERASSDKDEINSNEQEDQVDSTEEGSQKDVKDEEKMLDSGSFELRESQRSANKIKPVVMDFIIEASEDTSDKKSSLTDEGFQEMSSSSAVSSMKTHVDVLDRPLFIDFNKSKEHRRKRKICERLKQRAKDLLNMISLHEMPYSLFEMKPIPYDLYMATFGKSNYTQIAIQTFDDGITEEVQTEEILDECKWTQHPIDFSNHDIYLKPDNASKKYGRKNDDFLTKFTFLMTNNSHVDIDNKINTDKDYKSNPLRIYLEQKDGVGIGEMLPYEKYKSKIKNNDFSVNRLRKFLKRAETRMCHVLNINTGNSEMADLVKTPNLPFSKGYISISPKNIFVDELAFLKFTKITGLLYSESKSNLIMTIHNKNSNGVAAGKCIVCLWDICVARRDPIKVLVAIDNITKGRLRGNTDGIFVASLEDGSIHLWDLSEEPSWRSDVASEEKTAKLVEINSDRMTQTEIDREWNLKNSHVGNDERSPLHCALQACAYTTSAANISSTEGNDSVVGLEFIGDARAIVTQDSNRKVIGQVCSLQRVGILTIWSIVQEKTKISLDLGKAYWSKMKLERTQTIFLSDHFDVPTKDITDDEILIKFNLNSAKRRLSNRKQERNLLRKDISRPKSAISSEFDIDRPASAASIVNKIVLPTERKVSHSWENGIVCCDLKIVNLDKSDFYLVAKNSGEVLCCTRGIGAMKINRFCIATDTSSVTCLDVSPHGLPYFLAATDTGTVNLCSIVDARVLLTLDCRNGPPTDGLDKCQSDHKGRYVSSAVVRSPTHTAAADTRVGSKLSISSIHWSHTNPCCMYAVLCDGAVCVWELTHSDICARYVCMSAALASAHSDGTLAVLTPDGEVQVHKLANDHRNTHYLDLFQKYVTLL